jgi:hypothetical protein
MCWRGFLFDVLMGSATKWPAGYRRKTGKMQGEEKKMRSAVSTQLSAIEESRERWSPREDKWKKSLLSLSSSLPPVCKANG